MMNLPQHPISKLPLTEFKLVTSLILFAIFARIALPSFLSHLPNFSPIDAIALFCGAYFRRSASFLVTLLVIAISDLIINKLAMGQWVLFYKGFYWQYSCYILITGIGIMLPKKGRLTYLAPACIASSFLFYIISNFGVWSSGFLYPHTVDGLTACYIAAIPFFKNTLFSDLLFSLVLFASFEWVRIQFPTLISIKSKKQR